MCVCVCVCVCVFRRSQHCEVEKRRRERMNRYMNELAQMIPTCAAVPRRLDKLSILKMAVDHMKSLRGTIYTVADLGGIQGCNGTPLLAGYYVITMVLS